ncbi:MAG: Methyltransferase type 12 [Cellvibrio sp.]|nr:Methyltransferase type 12 [Cellvibrio sp.]
MRHLTRIDCPSLAPVTGIWGSFSLSYLKNPVEFINHLYGFLQPGGWIALVDVSCFISGNMLPDSKHYERVKAYEQESGKSGVYDFDFGSKIETLLRQAGFRIIHTDNNVTDAELNFDGAASPQVLRNWNARCERLVMLLNTFPNQYAEICAEIIAGLQSHAHAKANNVRFVVAYKK